MKMSCPTETVREYRDYFSWLLYRCGFDEDTIRDGWLIFYTLHQKEFYWSEEFPNDVDRNTDGLLLRQMYTDDTTIIPDHQTLPYSSSIASVLEVLIALALRMDFIIGGDFGPGSLLLEMLTNMELYPFSPKNSVPNSKSVLVQDEIFGTNLAADRWLSRDFDEFGTKTPFFVPKLKNLYQNRIQIWYMMNNYLCAKLGQF